MCVYVRVSVCVVVVVVVVVVVDSALLVLSWQVRVDMLCRCDVSAALTNCLCCLMTGRVCGSVAAGGR